MERFHSSDSRLMRLRSHCKPSGRPGRRRCASHLSSHRHESKSPSEMVQLRCLVYVDPAYCQHLPHRRWSWALQSHPRRLQPRSWWQQDLLLIVGKDRRPARFLLSRSRQPCRPQPAYPKYPCRRVVSSRSLELLLEEYRLAIAPLLASVCTYGLPFLNRGHVSAQYRRQKQSHCSIQFGTLSACEKGVVRSKSRALGIAPASPRTGLRSHKLVDTACLEC